MGRARRAADTPLPHPEQLLILRKRIIFAKVAAVRNMVNKQSREEREADNAQSNADSRNCSDRFSDEFLRYIDPPPLCYRYSQSPYFTLQGKRTAAYRNDTANEIIRASGLVVIWSWSGRGE